jgi:molybdopterin synthase catalytic subunit
VSVRVQREDFDVGAEVSRLATGRTDIGAIVTFTGTVRSGHGDAIESMTLEHYPGMTEEELARIEAEAGERWPLSASLIVHRVGTLAPGDNIVLVVTASAHRQAAFEAAAFLMDYLKTRAPFWKKELGRDGSGDWVEARTGDDRAVERWDNVESLRQLVVDLFIVHPTLTPAEIDAGLGLVAQIAHRVGDRRMTPKGTLLAGTYQDTRWRYSIRHEVRAQHFADKVAELLARLEPHKPFLADLRATGGTATVNVVFLDGYFGDALPPRTLAKLAELQLRLGITAYNVPQT